MTPPKSFQPVLLPEDLGIDLEEDSVDVTEEEVAEALDTDDQDQLVALMAEFVREAGRGLFPPTYELRRKGGILFCRVLVGGQRKLYRAEWLRKSK